MRIGHEAAVGESEVAGCRPRFLAGSCEEGVCALGMRHECNHQPRQDQGLILQEVLADMHSYLKSQEWNIFIFV